MVQSIRADFESAFESNCDGIEYGVSGWTTYQGLEAVREYGLKYQPTLSLPVSTMMQAQTLTDGKSISSLLVRKVKVFIRGRAFVIAREALLAGSEGFQILLKRILLIGW